MATRVLVTLMLTASVACAVIGWVYWHRLSWPSRVVLEVIPVLFFGTRDDVRRTFISYGRYRREWAERHGGSSPE